MRGFSSAATAVLLLVTIAGCTTTPAARVATAAAATAAPAAPAASTLTTPAADDAAATAKTARDLGLAARQSNGSTVYCHSEAQIGTRLQTTTCYTKEQLPALAKRTLGNQEAVESLRRKSLVQPASN